jgi:hypothetical protein
MASLTLAAQSIGIAPPNPWLRPRLAPSPGIAFGALSFRFPWINPRPDRAIGADLGLSASGVYAINQREKARRSREAQARLVPLFDPARDARASKRDGAQRSLLAKARAGLPLCGQRLHRRSMDYPVTVLPAASRAARIIARVEIAAAAETRRRAGPDFCIRRGDLWAVGLQMLSRRFHQPLGTGHQSPHHRAHRSISAVSRPCVVRAFRMRSSPSAVRGGASPWAPDISLSRRSASVERRVDERHDIAAIGP